MPKDRVPLLKDRTETDRTEPTRRQPDIVVCTSTAGHVADAKATVR